MHGMVINEIPKWYYISKPWQCWKLCFGSLVRYSRTMVAKYILDQEMSLKLIYVHQCWQETPSRSHTRIYFGHGSLCFHGTRVPEVINIGPPSKSKFWTEMIQGLLPVWLRLKDKHMKVEKFQVSLSHNCKEN